MNSIYLVKRTDDVGYDEYDAFVVIAPDEPTALAKAIEAHPRRSIFSHGSVRIDGSNVKIREIIASQEDIGVLLGSFNAG